MALLINYPSTCMLQWFIPRKVDLIMVCDFVVSDASHFHIIISRPIFSFHVIISWTFLSFLVITLRPFFSFLVITSRPFFSFHITISWPSIPLDLRLFRINNIKSTKNAFAVWKIFNRPILSYYKKATAVCKLRMPSNLWIDMKECMGNHKQEGNFITRSI